MKGKIISLIILISILGRFSADWVAHYYNPQQVHLSLTEDPTQMMVTWVTFWQTNTSMVKYGIQEPDMLEFGTEELFPIEDSYRKLFIHRVTLYGLTPGHKYYYRCGSHVSWSPLFFFTVMKAGNKWSPRICVYGDMGNIGGQCIPRLQEYAQDGYFDMVHHVGDLAYNLDADHGKIGDEFMRQIEPIAAYVPYMVSPGNHEHAYNFSHYKARFSMPKNGDGENMYYSYNVGPVHIMSFSTEVYYYFIDDKHTYANKMFDWIVKDLQIANRPENRAVRPWIIAVAHKPMYCSNWDDNPICQNKNNPVRVGFHLQPEKNLEDVFCKYGVDIYFSGHEHSYERLLPIYNFRIQGGSKAKPYTNPKAPVHIITGSAGNQEIQDKMVNKTKPFSVYRTLEYGFTIMYVHNLTHINLQQVSDDRGGKVIDEVWVIKEKIGAPKFNCTK